MKHWLARGNRKISDNTLIWNLPAVDTCGQHCKGCYAYIAQRRFNTIYKARKQREHLSKDHDFVEVLSNEIKIRHPRYVRVHESGDFYSQEYIEKWAKIAKENPDVTFYAYTKRFYDFDFSKILELDNFVLHNSVLPNNQFNYGKKEVVEKLAEEFDGFICPMSKDREKRCMEECTWCAEKANQGTPILFEYH